MNVKIAEIQKKIQKMNKSEIINVCCKMKYPTGTKHEMIKNLLRPLKMKYKMDSDDDIEYIYSSEEEENDNDNEELLYSEEEKEEKEENKKIEQSKPIKKYGLNLQNIPMKYEDQLNDLYMHSINADRTRNRPPYSREEIKVFLNDLKMIKNRHIVEDAYNRFKKYMNDWRTQGGYPVDPELFISNATDNYKQKRNRSREIIRRSLGKKYLNII